MSQPLDGRRIWFVGIGGAGLSAYAKLARAWGAEVGGWDRVQTPYVHGLEGVRIEIAPEPVTPPGWEVVVSTAFRDRAEGKSRAAFLAELVSLQDSIVVAGAHGKTTTTAMIAFCLDRLGLDPSFLIGGDVPQLGGNARAGTGWLVVEGDESDRTVEALHPEIAVVTNRDLDHHSTFASRSEVESLFEKWLSDAPRSVRGWELEPVELPLAVIGEHNRRNAATALETLSLAGVDRDAAAAALVEFRGVGRRFELRGETAGVAVYDEYAHHPVEVAAALAAARDLRPDGRVLVLFQPHLFSRTRHLAREFGFALAHADAVAVTEIYPSREDPVEGVTGKLVANAAAEARPGAEVGWTPTLEDGVRFIARRARAGDVVLTVGAGDVERAGPLLLEALS